MIADENQAQLTVNVGLPEQYFVDNLTMLTDAAAKPGCHHLRRDERIIAPRREHARMVGEGGVIRPTHFLAVLGRKGSSQRLESRSNKCVPTSTIDLMAGSNARPKSVNSNPTVGGDVGITCLVRTPSCSRSPFRGCLHRCADGRRAACRSGCATNRYRRGGLARSVIRRRRRLGAADRSSDHADGKRRRGCLAQLTPEPAPGQASRK